MGTFVRETQADRDARAPAATMSHALPSPHPFARLAQNVASLCGYELLKRHYYTGIPLLRDIPRDAWSHPHPMPGVRFNRGAGGALLRDELAPYLVEFVENSARAADVARFDMNNGYYESVDAEVLYAFVRWLKPRRIIELGSGHTTKLLVTAAARNASEGSLASVTSYDPYPDLDALNPLSESLVEPMHVRDIAASAFNELGPRDILFVDTTHTVHVASEVNHIVLRILPCLSPGVVVHFHDVFLPWEYPSEFILSHRCYWAEQYLLHAFLAQNPTYEVLFSAQAVVREESNTLNRFIPSFRPGSRSAREASAFWIQRR